MCFVSPQSSQSAYNVIKIGKGSLVLHSTSGLSPRLNFKMSVSENTCENTQFHNRKNVLYVK